MRATVVGALAVALIAGLALWLWWPQSEYRWQLPSNVPPPKVPADNPMQASKVELGRRLFYDTRLSAQRNVSCATCHRQELAFTDARSQALGTRGDIHPRGSMSLVNVAYASRLNWANHLQDRLEIQALTPLFGETPPEMGSNEADMLAVLRSDAEYRRLLPDAFPDDADPYSVLNALRALASFTRSIVSFNSPYDRLLRGDESALSDSQKRGMELFFSERFECFHCHGGFNFTDSSTHANAVVDNAGFHNTGLYNIGGNGDYPPDNTGLYDLTGQRRDMGRFKAPTLRNVAVTAPYMHDGSIATLDGVLDHYARGGRELVDGHYAGDGRHNPYRSEFVQGFELTPTERADLLAFLNALTDESLLDDPKFRDPFAGNSK
ncbi:MAG: MbnH family di-heme enzyme [Woeseia sp.]